MTVKYEWKIEQLVCYLEKEGKKNVVYHVYWRLNASLDGYEDTAYGSINIQLDPESEFTPYENLTKDQVVSWVKIAMGEESVANLEASLNQKIEYQMNPPIVTPPIPWAINQI